LLFSTTDNATLKFNVVYIDGPKIAEKMDKVIEVKSLNVIFRLALLMISNIYQALK
jgi:hypothetical protein